LLKEWSVKVEIASVIERIPFVTVPAFATIIGDVEVWWILGEGFVVAEATFSWIKVVLITEGCSSLLSAVRAVGWRWDGVFFIVENGGDLIVEF